MWVAVVVAAALVAYNSVVNAVPALRSALLALNAASLVAVVALVRWGGMGWGELGLGRDGLTAGLRWGAGIAVGVGVAALAAVLLAGRSDVLGAVLSDRRVSRVGGADGLAFHALVRIPVATAALEEVAFRGVLLALFARHLTVPGAIVWSSVAFGLWHLAPVLGTLEVNRVGATVPARAGATLAALLLAGVAGALLCVLRLVSGSLVAPVFAHWAINSLSLSAAWWAQR